MSEFDPTIPHDLSLVQFRDPHQSLGMTYSASLGGAYSAGTVSGVITRLQLMPGGFVVASVAGSDYLSTTRYRCYDAARRSFRVD